MNHFDIPIFIENPPVYDNPLIWKMNPDLGISIWSLIDLGVLVWADMFIDPTFISLQISFLIIKYIQIFFSFLLTSLPSAGGRCSPGDLEELTNR